MGSWTSKDLQFLKDNYGKLKAKEIADYLGRTKKAVQSKAYVLGVKSNRKSKKEFIGEHKSEVDNINYKFGELKAPKDNWYALYLCIVKNYSIGQALSIMNIGHDYRQPLIENNSQELHC